jgi:two-component system, chemotaxis family, protein-glutamate methylesterase/glutaminase
VVRQVVGGLLQDQPGIEVIATCSDPLLAQERMSRQWPDVIVLDVEMPRMYGITFLREIMAERPTPVVICSTLTEAGARTTLEAMSAGAVAIVTKPKLGLKEFLHDSADELIRTVRAAARANLRVLVTRAGKHHETVPEPKHTADAVLPAAGPRAMLRTTQGSLESESLRSCAASHRRL